MAYWTLAVAPVHSAIELRMTLELVLIVLGASVCVHGHPLRTQTFQDKDTHGSNIWAQIAFGSPLVRQDRF